MNVWTNCQYIWLNRNEYSFKMDIFISRQIIEIRFLGKKFEADTESTALSLRMKYD